MRTPKGKPKGRAASTAAVAIDGADSKGKVNDKEVCGDAAAVMYLSVVAHHCVIL